MKRRSLRLILPRFVLVLLLFILLVTTFTGTAFAEAVIRISSQEQVAAGEDFTVDISIKPDEEIAGIQFDFAFDSSLVSVKEVREEALLKQAGSDTMFKPGDIDNSQGIVTGIYGFILGKNTASSPGTFAEIDLTSTGRAGVCELQLSNVIVSDSSGHEVPVRIVNSTVQIEDSPELSSKVPSGEKQSGGELTEESTEKERSEERITEEKDENDQDNQPASQSIFSSIYDLFQSWFST
jgi:hypothetical protein